MLRLVVYHLRNHRQQTSLYTFSLITLLYTIADGIITFYLPLAAKNILPSMALVGLVLASSSFWDIVADVFLGFKDQEVKHKHLIKWAFFLALILLASNFLSITSGLWVRRAVLLLSMLLWGFHYEAMVWGIYDFIIDTTEKAIQAMSFGVVEVFRFLGYSIGPIIAGMAILVSEVTTLGSAGVFVVLGLLLFFLFASSYREPVPPPTKTKMNFRNKWKLWKRIGKKIFPLLLVTGSLGIFNGVVFSMTPILVESKPGFHLLGGFIVGAFSIPVILFTGLFGKLADKYGKHQFILLGAFLIVLTLSVFGMVDNPWVVVVLALVAGTGTSLLYPALDAQYSNYIEDHADHERETLGEMGVAVNLGFIVGAALGGILVSLTGNFWLTYLLVAIAFAASGVFYFQGKQVLDGN